MWQPVPVQLASCSNIYYIPHYNDYQQHRIQYFDWRHYNLDWIECYSVRYHIQHYRAWTNTHDQP